MKTKFKKIPVNYKFQKARALAHSRGMSDEQFNKIVASVLRIQKEMDQK